MIEGIFKIDDTKSKGPLAYPPVPITKTGLYFMMINKT